jgi:spore coat protein U-like protein
MAATTGGTVAQRLMFRRQHAAVPAVHVAALGTVWGDGTGSSVTQSGTGAGIATANSLTVYGQVPDNATNQAAVPASYTDTITVTVTY